MSATVYGYLSASPISGWVNTFMLTGKIWEKAEVCVGEKQKQKQKTTLPPPAQKKTNNQPNKQKQQKSTKYDFAFEGYVKMWDRSV